jgi:hypothetical protein
MRIKNFKNFNEAANGVDLWNGSMPLTPRLKVHNTITPGHTLVLYGQDGNFYTEQDFQDLQTRILQNADSKGKYDEYTKDSIMGQITDFNQKNLDILISFL